MNRYEIIRMVKLELAGIKVNPTKMEEGDMENPCEEGYIAYGTKEKDGRTVPNCVPEKMKKLKKDGFPIPSPEGSEEENTFISRCVSSIIDEYDQDVALGICYSKWNEK